MSIRFPLLQPASNFSFFVTMWDVQSPFSMSVGDDVAIGIASAITNIAMQFLSGGFAEVSGLQGTLETEDYNEGGFHPSPRKFVKGASYPDLVFKRGITFDPQLSDWYYQAKTGMRPRLRKDGLIFLLERNGVDVSQVPVPGLLKVPVAIWYFHRAFPKRMEGPALNARGNEIAIETLVLNHEGVDRLSPAMIPGVGDFLATVGI